MQKWQLAQNFLRRKKTKGNFFSKIFIFLVHILSPTLNYSLTKSSYHGKDACKRSIAQLQQDLLSTRCEVKKLASPCQKKDGKSQLWGLIFSKRDANCETKTGERREPIPRIAIPKGGDDPSKRWAIPQPQTSEKSGFLPSGEKKENLPNERCEGHTSKIEQNRFSCRFPLCQFL